MQITDNQFTAPAATTTITVSAKLWPWLRVCFFNLVLFGCALAITDAGLQGPPADGVPHQAIIGFWVTAIAAGLRSRARQELKAIRRAQGATSR